MEQLLTQVSHLLCLYIDDLRLTMSIYQQFPDIDIARELGALTLGTHDVPSPRQMLPESPETSDSDDYVGAPLTDKTPDAFNMSFFGKSSPFPLVRKAARTKNLLRGNSDNSRLSMCSKRSEFWLPPEVRCPSATKVTRLIHFIFSLNGECFMLRRQSSTPNFLRQRYSRISYSATSPVSNPSALCSIVTSWRSS